ncbi:hypothetical protein [Streptosporangium subroseum]|uniref:hypothetical protein n=1 Tax=Streptosporangium subroseum TaxID=106412 RepID=UPI0030882B01|nr:hypothetical protein OHB15_17140 [Streptosporangium subroseum]
MAPVTVRGEGRRTPPTGCRSCLGDGVGKSRMSTGRVAVSDDLSVLGGILGT